MMVKMLEIFVFMQLRKTFAHFQFHESVEKSGKESDEWI